MSGNRHLGFESRSLRWAELPSVVREEMRIFQKAFFISNLGHGRAGEFGQVRRLDAITLAATIPMRSMAHKARFSSRLNKKLKRAG